MGILSDISKVPRSSSTPSGSGPIGRSPWSTFMERRTAIRCTSLERYRLIDYDAAKAAQERSEKENQRVPTNNSGIAIDQNYRGKGLQLEFVVEDEGVFTMPWSATVTYRRGVGQWPEYVCSENAHLYYEKGDAAVPRAATEDF